MKGTPHSPSSIIVLQSQVPFWFISMNLCRLNNFQMNRALPLPPSDLKLYIKNKKVNIQGNFFVWFFWDKKKKLGREIWSLSTDYMWGGHVLSYAHFWNSSQQTAAHVPYLIILIVPRYLENLSTYLPLEIYYNWRAFTKIKAKHCTRFFFKSPLWNLEPKEQIIDLMQKY